MSNPNEIQRDLFVAISFETRKTANLQEFAAHEIRNEREAVKTLFESVLESRDVGAILNAERKALELELRNLASSDEKVNSLETAISELDSALHSLTQVQNAAYYTQYNQHMDMPRNRLGDLPKDQARQFFKSHLARLRNASTGRTSVSEVEVMQLRRDCILAAQEVYIELQRKVLGIDAFDADGIREPQPVWGRVTPDAFQLSHRPGAAAHAVCW